MQEQNVKGTRQRKRKGKGIANKGAFKEMKGAETAVKCKEVKGYARKLSGKTCKGSEVPIIPKTNRIWRERKSKNGKGWWPAVSRPPTGRDRAAGQARRALGGA